MASASVRIGGYSLEVDPNAGSFVRFEENLESERAGELRAALAEEPEDQPALAAAVGEFEDSAKAVTGRIEEADKLFRAAAAGQLDDPKLITGEVNTLLDLLEHLDRNGRFEEQLKLMRSLNGLLALLLRWLDLARSLRSLLDSADAAGHRAGQAWAHHELGSLHLCAGEPEKASEHLHQALRIEEQLGDIVGRCATRHNLDSARRDLTLPGGGRGPPPRRLLRLVGLVAVFTVVGAAATGIAVAVHGGGGSPSPTVTHTLTVELAGGGTGSVTGAGLDCPEDCASDIEDGGSVTLAATAKRGSTFDRWDGVDCGRKPVCKLAVTHDVSATATFERAAVTQAPTAPTNLRAKAVSVGEVDLSWSPSSDDKAVTSYVVYRDSAKLTTVGGAKTTFQDTTVAASTEYAYSVRATDAAGNVSPQSNQASATTPASADTEAPTTPTGLRATAVSSGEIDLSWIQSTDNVAVTGYIVYRNRQRLTTVPGTASTFKDTAVAASTGYVYSVQATDAAGNLSAQSSLTKAKTPTAADTEAPSTPNGLSATAVSAGEIDLSWGASTDNIAVTGYVIYRNSLRLTTVAGTTTTYRDTSVAASTAYSYTVQATDAAGNLSARSKVARTKTRSAAPG